jgi:AAA ATPase domain
MRVTRILLRNYRGVQDCEVRFAPCGVTVVEGPNECGKSSLAEALSIALNEKESSKKKNVRDLKRTDRDVPTEVEVDVETGPYRFTLSKAFNKRSRAELQVHAPKPETLTGGEVHARVRQILEETVDIRLLEALWVQQGAKVEQTSLAGCTSLGEALDRAAGTVPAGDREETLLERAGKDYARYWTPSGGEGRELVGSVRREQELKAQFDAAVEDEGRLQTYIEASERLQHDVADLALELEREVGRSEDWQVRLREVDQAEAGIAGLEARARTTEVERDAAVKARETRAILIIDVDAAAANAGERHAKLAEFDENLEPLVEQKAAADAERDEIHRAIVDARALLDVRTRDRQYLDDLVHLQMLRERIGRVEKVSGEVAAAQAVLERVRVDKSAVASLRKMAGRFQTETIRRDALSASAIVEAHQAVDVAVDGDPIGLGEGQRLERVVSTATRFDIGRLVTITVGPGIAVDEQSSTVAQANRSLREALSEVGATTMEEAEDLFSQRADAARTVDAGAEQMAQDLRDLSTEELRERAARLEASTNDYIATRPPESTLPGDTEDARRLETEAREVYEELNGRYPLIEAAAKAKDTEHQNMLKQRVTLDAECQAATTDVGRLSAQLKRERASESDERLAAEAADHVSAHEAAAAALRSAKVELDGRDPVATRLRAGNAEQVLTQVRSQLGDKRRDLAAAEAGIDALSPTGLFTRREAIEAAHQAAREEDQRLRRRAAASKLLLQTLRNERTQAQRAYVEPLRREIERRGRTVFGPDFAVEMDEDQLAVTRRQLNGVWVSWEQLSVGAQEQLGIIARLAAAALVSADGGAPLIIDDALGHSDDERLDAMCAVLGAAGGTMQIIALTCTPSRYRRIGGATTISMLEVSNTSDRLTS